MSEDIPLPVERIGPSHYYGDTVRILFVINAVLVLGAQLFGVAFLTPAAALATALILVVAAGLTNPVQAWIHWANAFISGGGLLLASNFVLTRYTAGELFSKGLLVMAVAVLFLVALYCSVKTLRGVLMRNAPIIK